MRIAILAADDVKRWARHRVQIGGETLLQRIVRQLKERDQFDVCITEKERGQHYSGNFHMAVAFILNPMQGNDMGCIYGIKDVQADLYIFGDVYFTDEALDKILAGKDEFYGRTKAGKAKAYGEMFAIKNTPRVRETIDVMWSEYISGKIQRFWSWDLYSRIQGKDFYKHRNTGNFTEIHDMTEDFDKPDDLTKWKTQYGIK